MFHMGPYGTKKWPEGRLEFAINYIIIFTVDIGPEF